MQTVHELSAGGVAVARDPLRVAIVKVRAPSGEERWALPKGLAEPRESRAETAAREVREETGFEVEVVAPAGDVEYWFVMGGVRHHKQVRFFLMDIVGGDPSAHDAEVEEVALVEPEEARRRMAYADERRMVGDALALADHRISPS